MQVEVLSRSLEAEYCRFVSGVPHSLIYSSLEYRDFLACAVGGRPTYLVALEGVNQISGVLPYFELEVPGVGKVINSLPWYGSHGGCIVAGPKASEARHSLLREYRSVAEREDVLFATLILSPHEENAADDYKFILEHSIEDYRIGQLTPIPELSEAIESNLESIFRQKTRNLVRKANKQGFLFHERDDATAWQFLHDTHVENMRAIGGKSKPWNHFVAIRDVLPRDCRRLFIAELNGVAVAALLLFYFNGTVEYVTPVIKHEYRSMQPLSFLIWHAMLDAARSGYRWWNWGGTWISQASLHHFKAGWGAHDFPYRYCTIASKLGLSRLRQDRQGTADLFPYYYIFPFEKL